MIFDPILLIITIVFAGIGFLVSARLKNKFNHYSQTRLSSGLTGKDVAERMLKQYGIFDVTVKSVDGFLSDHYNPADKTVNLSPAVYSGVNIAAAAVAAHECGHAVQHNTAYTWLTMRSKMVPVVQFASMAATWISLGLAFLAYMNPGLTNTMLLLFIIIQSVITLFSIITLPVEVDASKRALVWLEDSRIANYNEVDDAKDALKWAAYTYFVNALASIATLLYYIMRFTGNNRED
ncbi:MAG: zinc metallopeptidase [Bacteroidota bacterium]|jgi:Zn-dependent membrane protease YugP